jgi:hypothetical protein
MPGKEGEEKHRCQLHSGKSQWDTSATIAAVTVQPKVTEYGNQIANLKPTVAGIAVGGRTDY